MVGVEERTTWMLEIKWVQAQPEFLASGPQARWAVRGSSSAGHRLCTHPEACLSPWPWVSSNLVTCSDHRSGRSLWTSAVGSRKCHQGHLVERALGKSCGGLGLGRQRRGRRDDGGGVGVAGEHAVGCRGQQGWRWEACAPPALSPGCVCV